MRRVREFRAELFGKGTAFYVLAGWVVPIEAIGAAKAAVEHARKAICPQRPELKTTAFLGGERQKLAAYGLFERLGAFGCVPLFLTAEKRFCVAAKIVETFLDPAYNDAIFMQFTSDVHTKQELANTLYERLPDDVITRFALAYRNPTEELFSVSLKEIVSVVRQHVNPELAEVLQAAERRLSALADAEADQSVLGKVSATLNMPCLELLYDG